MPKKLNDFVPVVDGRTLAADELHVNFAGYDELGGRSELDLQLIRMLALHRELCVKFRSQDLSKLSDSTKRAMLTDMNDVLGIKPLR